MASTIAVFEEEKTKLDDIKKKVPMLETKFTKATVSVASDCELKVKQCDESVSRNGDLEMHVKENHENAEKHKCNICEKTFVLEWRMRKHMNGNTAASQFCHYYNNNVPCPYEAIGCKFLTVQTEFCSLKDCQDLLCPLAHQNVTTYEEPMENE